MKCYKIAKEYSLTPGPRYIAEGQFSGSHFRDTVLKPLIEKCIVENKLLKIDLDGTLGYGCAFLEESFGGLIRVYGFDLKALKSFLIIKSDEEPYLIGEIWGYLTDAVKESYNDK